MPRSTLSGGKGGERSGFRNEILGGNFSLGERMRRRSREGRENPGESSGNSKSENRKRVLKHAHENATIYGMNVWVDKGGSKEIR